MIEFLVHSLIGKILVWGVAAFVALRYSAGIYAWRQAELLERPSYDVIQKLSNGVEVRRYEPYLIAETTVDGQGFREPTSQGFRTCAGYIFGKNKSRQNRNEPEKMAMTSPVRVESNVPVGEMMDMTAPVRVIGGKGKQNSKVSFVIGSKYSLKTVPKPMDKKVRLKEVPSHILAVRKFSGPPPKDDRVKKERQILEQSLEDVDLQAKNDEETLVYGYHDPFLTPNILRKNEVAVVIEGKV